MTPGMKNGLEVFVSVWNGESPAALHDCCVHNVKYHSYWFDDPISGREALGAHIRNVRAAFPDLLVVVEEAFAEERKVVVKWAWTGTHKGQFMGIPATGKVVRQHGIDIAHMEPDGSRIEEIYNVSDRLAVLRAIGAIPSDIRMPG